MLYYTNYANKKFDILNKYKVFFTKEQVEDAVNLPDKLEKKEKYFISHKDGIEVILQKEEKIIKIITFYPVK